MFNKQSILTQSVLFAKLNMGSTKIWPNWCAFKKIITAVSHVWM